MGAHGAGAPLMVHRFSRRRAIVGPKGLLVQWFPERPAGGRLEQADLAA